MLKHRHIRYQHTQISEKKTKINFQCTPPLTTFFQVHKLQITTQRKVPILKHGHIRNQHTQISEKKQKKTPYHFLHRVKTNFFKNKIR